MSELAAAQQGDTLRRLGEAECALVNLRKELDHTHQLATLGTLMAGIAHEINNILTPVLAYAQLAQANPNDAELRDKALDRAVAGVESASRITEAVLGFARSDGGPEFTRIREVINSTLACLGRDPTRDGITLSIEVSPPDASVRIRPLALQQVLLNMFLNATRALQREGNELRVAVTQSEKMTSITVTDNGPGIPPELAEKLFEPFVTTGSRKNNSMPAGGADETKTIRLPEHGGSGLGLAVCKRLIENSGGTIVVSSPPASGHSSHGAEFVIKLPTHAEDQFKKAASSKQKPVGSRKNQ